MSNCVSDCEMPKWNELICLRLERAVVSDVSSPLLW